MSALVALLQDSGPVGRGAAEALASALRATPGLVLVGLDLEACAGPGGDARDPDKARIVQVAIAEVSATPLPGQVDASEAASLEAAGDVAPEDLERVEPLPGPLYAREDAALVDPVCEVDAASSAVHGITGADLDGAPRIEDLIEVLAARLLPEGRPVVLCGYNGAAYDAPLLAAELRRAAGRVRRAEPDRAALAEQVAAAVLAATWIDPLAVRKRAEPMDLSGSVRRYLGARLQGAHNAASDIAGTVLVLGAQIAAGHAASLEDALAASAAPAGAVDRAGKLICDEGAAPSAATVRYAFGKSKGKTIADDPGYARWMLTADFSEDTKAHLRALLATLPADAGARGPRAYRR